MRSSIRTLSLITCCVLIAGCSSAFRLFSPSLKLSSTVVDYDGSGVYGVEVKVIDGVEREVGADTTDANGGFRIELTNYNKEGKYELIVAKDLIVEAHREPLDLASGGNPVPPQIEVSVLGAVRGLIQNTVETPVVAANVAILTEDGEEYDNTDTRSGGVFGLGYLEPGEYKLRIFDPRYLPSESPYFEIGKGEIKDVGSLLIERVPLGGISAIDLKKENKWTTISITPKTEGRLQER